MGAVDRSVLLQTMGESVKEESDGESSVDEFGVSASEGEGIAIKEEKPREAPMILPVGWRIEMVRRRKRECREIVDPTGKRYSSMKEARRAIDMVRRSDNTRLSLSSMAN